MDRDMAMSQAVWPLLHTKIMHFFEAATLVTMHILNYNICNTYFSIQNNTRKIKMITTLAITHMLKFTTLANFKTYNYNSGNYQSFTMQIM